MTSTKSTIMKGGILITIYFLTSSFLAAQVSDYTYSDSKSVSSDSKYGQLILEMPFGAKLYKNNYLKAQDLLDNIKNMCKGKAIFIDFWATWCSPCLEAMPNNRRLYIETKNLPIEFIYVCTDYRTNMENWISKISILKQQGVHIFVDDEIINAIFRLLQIGGGFPSYIFIDAKGEFMPGAIPQYSSTTTDRLSGLIKNK